jgi:hypothetical protein
VKIKTRILNRRYGRKGDPKQIRLQKWATVPSSKKKHVVWNQVKIYRCYHDWVITENKQIQFTELDQSWSECERRDMETTNLTLSGDLDQVEKEQVSKQRMNTLPTFNLDHLIHQKNPVLWTHSLANNTSLLCSYVKIIISMEKGTIWNSHIF